MKAKLQEMIGTLESSITTITSKLEAPVLDGTPYLICHEGPDGIRVLGDWPVAPGKTVRGFRHISTAPSHLCGLPHYSEDSADRVVAQLTRVQSHPAGAPGTFYRIHWRIVLERRLLEDRLLLNSLKSTLSQMAN